MPDVDILPDDIDTLRAALVAERAARLSTEARATGAEAMIAHLKPLIAKLQRDRFGPTSERSRRLLDQSELQLEELEANAAEVDVEPAAPGDPRPGSSRARPVRSLICFAASQTYCHETGRCRGCRLPQPPEAHLRASRIHLVDKGLAMTQNVYDKAEFFEGYSKLPRSVEGLDGAAEWASMRALLPNLQNLKIIDLGCGFGWFCRWAIERGAASAMGVDVSENMLARARDATTNNRISYVRSDLEHLDLPADLFHLAYSSLALHYVENLPGLLSTVHRSLRSGGQLVMSIEHPIYMAPSKPDWLADEQGGRAWPVDRYLVEGPRMTDWLAPGVIKQHRTIGTTVNHLIRCGFVVSHVEEWGPTDAQIAAHPDWAEARDRPMFLLIAAHR